MLHSNLSLINYSKTWITRLLWISYLTWGMTWKACLTTSSSNSNKRLRKLKGIPIKSKMRSKPKCPCLCLIKRYWKSKHQLLDKKLLWNNKLQQVTLSSRSFLRIKQTLKWRSLKKNLSTNRVCRRNLENTRLLKTCTMLLVPSKFLLLSSSLLKTSKIAFLTSEKN